LSPNWIRRNETPCCDDEGGAEGKTACCDERRSGADNRRRERRQFSPNARTWIWGTRSTRKNNLDPRRCTRASTSSTNLPQRPVGDNLAREDRQVTIHSTRSGTRLLRIRKRGIRTQTTWNTSPAMATSGVLTTMEPQPLARTSILVIRTQYSPPDPRFIDKCPNQLSTPSFRPCHPCHRRTPRRGDGSPTPDICTPDSDPEPRSPMLNR
jgi:hypothetical protein